MRNRIRIMIPLLTLFIVFLSHYFYIALTHNKVDECSIVNRDYIGTYQLDSCNSEVQTGFSYYINAQEYWIGFSYALALAFTSFTLLLFRENRKRGIAGAAGGLSLSVFIALGCYLLGCCGSPLLIIYLSLFGSKALGLAKPIVAGVTTLSVAGGYFLLTRKSKVCCDTGLTNLQVNDG